MKYEKEIHDYIIPVEFIPAIYYGPDSYPDMSEEEELKFVEFMEDHPDVDENGNSCIWVWPKAEDIDEAKYFHSFNDIFGWIGSDVVDCQYIKLIAVKGE